MIYMLDIIQEVIWIIKYIQGIIRFGNFVLKNVPHF
jgi:hypothetical protein